MRELLIILAEISVALPLIIGVFLPARLPAPESPSEPASQYTELSEAPTLVYPLVHSESEEIIWIEQYPTHYGLQITAHKTKPTLVHRGDCSETGMAGIHLDYWEKDGRDCLQVQLHDEELGPYEHSHWNIPPTYWQDEKDSSILLIKDILAWKYSDPDKEEETDGEGTTTILGATLAASIERTENA